MSPPKNGTSILDLWLSNEQSRFAVVARCKDHVRVLVLDVGELCGEVLIACVVRRDLTMLLGLLVSLLKASMKYLARPTGIVLRHVLMTAAVFAELVDRVVGHDCSLKGSMKHT